MNHTQAKFILRSYRPDGADALDPAFQEALAHARRDPVLSRWLEEEMELDRAIAGRLAQAPVPETLRDDVLALQRIRVLRPARRFRAGWFALAAAALLMLALGIHALWTPPLSIASYARVATDWLDQPFLLEVRDRPLDEIRTWLQANTRAGHLELPPALVAASQDSAGCKSFRWRGQEVVLVCFTLENGRPAHLFVMDRTALPDAAENDRVELARLGRWTTATWADGQRAYLLATLGSEQDLRALM